MRQNNKRNFKVMKPISVRFKEDGVIYKCTAARVKMKNKKLSVGEVHDVRWIDGQFYKATILEIDMVSNERFEELQGNICNSVEERLSETSEEHTDMHTFAESHPEIENIFKKKRKPSKKKWWSREEVEVVSNFFKRHLVREIIPKKDECERCIQESNGILKDREWKGVKYFIYSRITQNKKFKLKQFSSKSEFERN